jgi:ribokinase
MDLISYVDRLPVLGETLPGKRFAMGFGGKGANQAVMAAKLSARVTMVTKLGQDIFGENTLKNFRGYGIDTTHIHFTDRAFSGVAPIAVDPRGHNAIIIVLGANNELTAAEVEAARPAIAAADILICQNEIPLEINRVALTIARQEGVTTIYNPAPALKNVPRDLFSLSDLVCPNESETEILTGMAVHSLEEAEKAARLLISYGAGGVILTLGQRGSLYVNRETVHHVPVSPVRAVDTTGAGDCFMGGLAVYLACGDPVEKAMEKANRLAAISVQSPGTQTSFPDAKDLPDELKIIVGHTKPLRTETSEEISRTKMAAYIDHTILKPEAGPADIDRVCDEALSCGFAAVCVNSVWVARVARRLAGSPVRVCSVIGFPLGAMASEVKAAEARQAVQDGASELDMVINIGALKAGDMDAVTGDIAAVRAAAPAPVILKVIIETALLDEEEKRQACLAAGKAGADFVKTSTGFAAGGATVADIALMRKTVGPDMGVKASGGIRDFETALAMIRAGANRIGCGSSMALIA